MSLMDEAAMRLATAKDAYQRLLSQVDAKLVAAVRQDPSRLDAAKAMQADAYVGFDRAVLKPALQPTTGAPKRDEGVVEVGVAKGWAAPE